MKEYFNIDFPFEETIDISYVIGNNYNEVKASSEDEINLDKMVIYAINKIKDEHDIDFFRDGTLIKGLVNHMYTSYLRDYLNVTIKVVNNFYSEGCVINLNSKLNDKIAN